jgi:nucleotide-binding universal stress UspA family protein
VSGVAVLDAFTSAVQGGGMASGVRAFLRSDIVELFRAHLADKGDLRKQVRRVPAGPRLVARRPSTRLPRKGTPAGVAVRPRHSKASASGSGQKRLLLAVDHSTPSKRAVTYVGDLLGHRRGFRVSVVYVLPEFPPGLLEHGGAGDPVIEERLTATLRAERRNWIAEQKRQAQPVVETATESLRKAGLAPRSLEVRYCGPTNDAAVAEEILRLARARRCHTIVVARHSRSWLGHLVSMDLREKLARRAERLAIWSIG